MKYAGWNSRDSWHNMLDTSDYERNIHGTSIDVICKYKYIRNKYFFTLGFGLGSTKINYEFPGRSKSYLAMMNYTLLTAMDYMLIKNLCLGIEFSYYGMAHIDFAGGGKNFKAFQIKSGLTLILNFLNNSPFISL